jgi:hypothetical protein
MLFGFMSEKLSTWPVPAAVAAIPILWWGRDDYTQLRNMSPQKRRDALVSRFKAELKYASVKPWPIYERETRGKVMYYMIHALLRHLGSAKLVW